MKSQKILIFLGEVLLAHYYAYTESVLYAF